MSLEGKTALVTGARTGIGHAIAEHLAREAADVAAFSREIKPQDQVIQDVERRGRRALTIGGDVAHKADCLRLVETALAKFGRIDILVNNAGIFPAAPLVEITEEQWDRVLAVNLKGTFWAAQEAARRAMIPRQAGRIIIISSCDAKAPTAGIAHYAAAKAGVISLTRSMALESAPHHITANAVAPGWLGTPGVMQSERWREVVESIPAGRLALPREIAHAVAFLAGNSPEYITGATLHVNGGFITD